jgi:hypothetical protein
MKCNGIRDIGATKSRIRQAPSRLLADVIVLFKDHKWYLLDNDQVNALYDFISGIYQGCLYQSTGTQGSNNIVIVNYSQTGTSLFDAMEMVKDIWVERLQGDGVNFKPYRQFNKPPVWDESFEDLLNLRLSQCNQFIDTANHPYIEALLKKLNTNT